MIRYCSSYYWQFAVAVICAWLAHVVPAGAATRVALMDFSTDENSYRSAQAAVDFTQLLQVQLSSMPDIEWVERAELDAARQELKLSQMALLGGAPAMRWGRWAKADWIIKGHFSTDDHEQRTLSLQVIDLAHADVLATETLRFPPQLGPGDERRTEAVGLGAEAIRRTMKEALAVQTAAQQLTRVAPLFFINTSRWPLNRGTVTRSMLEAAVQAVAQDNTGLRMVQFPKAFQAIEESEMLFDGQFVGATNAWVAVADLYVWGGCSVTNSRGAGKLQWITEITVHTWDGVSSPVTFTETADRTLSAGEAYSMVERAVAASITRALSQRQRTDAFTIRRELSRSIVQECTEMTKPGRMPGPHDRGQIQELVHMLETACFLDPDNADASALLNATRWGFWLNFVQKNEFWSNWRASEVWGRHVDRFGLGSVQVALPFPLHRGGITNVYLSSLREVIQGFPQHLDWKEWSEANYADALRGAHFHGFPGDVSYELAVQWKAEMEAELAERNRRVEAFERANQLLVQTPSNAVPAPVSRPSPPPVREAGGGPAKQSGIGGRQNAALVEVPRWMREGDPKLRMFHLSPPPLLPVEVHPRISKPSFPPRFEVRTVEQLALRDREVFILAMDERSDFTTDLRAGLAAEVRRSRGRLWVLGVGEEAPVLFDPELLTNAINAFLLDGSHVWVAGETTGCLDTETRAFRTFGIQDGLNFSQSDSLAFAGGRLFAAGGFALSRHDPVSQRWIEVELPKGGYSIGGGRPVRISGGERWLCHIAGPTRVFDPSTAVWNLVPVEGMRCVLPTEAGFWFGGASGFAFKDIKADRLLEWRVPSSLQGIAPFAFVPAHNITAGQGLTAEYVERASTAVQHSLNAIHKQRVKVRLERPKTGEVNCPLGLKHRVPDEITSLDQDGDFLWVGAGDWTGHLLLLHRPTLAWVACVRMECRINCMVTDEQAVWVGSNHPDHPLLRVEKAEFLAVPRSRWVDLTISPEERDQVIRGMTTRDQAMYAFYAGDDARVAELLGGSPLEKLQLDELFILAFSFDVLGLDRPTQARACLEHIIERSPDSPWAEFARECIVDNDRNHAKASAERSLLAKYDRDGDGVLSTAERTAMKRDPAYESQQQAISNLDLDAQITAILRQFDRSRDGKLDSDELERLSRTVAVYADAKPEWLKGKTVLVEPLLTKQFPATASILDQYDADKDGHIDETELKALATRIRK